MPKVETRVLSDNEKYLLGVVEKHVDKIKEFADIPIHELLITLAYLTAMITVQEPEAGLAFDKELVPFFQGIYPSLIAQALVESGSDGADGFVIVLPKVDGPVKQDVLDGPKMQAPQTKAVS